jgi:hypothetical protein
VSLTGNLCAGDVGVVLALNCGFALAGATAAKLVVKAPVFGQAAAAPINIPTPLVTSGTTLSYTTLGTEFTVPGTYRVTVEVTLAAGVQNSPELFVVVDPIAT